MYLISEYYNLKNSYKNIIYTCVTNINIKFNNYNNIKPLKRACRSDILILVYHMDFCVAYMWPPNFMIPGSGVKIALISTVIY